MKKNSKEKLWIGTSNIMLPGNKSTFPEPFRQKSRLNYYSSLFNSVELNSPFYKIPLAATFEKWSGDVAEEFCFSVKLWKGITHTKDLDFKTADIKDFLQRANCLHNKKGCLLVQLPGKITLDHFNKIEAILTLIKSAPQAKAWTVAIEFRHASWYTGETTELLNAYKASMVLHDFPKGKNEILTTNVPVVYIRFHGPAGDYRGSYSHAFLKQKAALIKDWIKRGKDVYAYFNNTIGDAYQNAHTLKKLLTETAPEN